MPRLIDAKKLIEYFFRPYSNEESYSNIDIERIVNAQPTVDAEPVKHGHWNTERNPMMYQIQAYVHVCSECGTAFPYEMPYCGECGAKMDEVRDE